MDHYDPFDDFHEGQAQARAITRIRAFLRAPGLPSGGVLLISGRRGVGKTRLVDRALTDRRKTRWKEEFKCKEDCTGERIRLRNAEAADTRYSGSNSNSGCCWGKLFHNRLCWLRSCLAHMVLAPLWSHDRWRVRRREKRDPRGVERLLLPVAVDPFFPDDRDGGIGGEHSSEVNSDQVLSVADRDARALIHNLVFGLTSVIDPRRGPRRFGRTLGAWIGWWILWFSPTALLRPKGFPTWPQIWMWLLLAFWIGGGLGWMLLRVLDMTGPLEAVLNTDVILISIPGTLFAVFLGWLVLRWADLRGLQVMGGQLYDLVHAQNMEKAVQMELERSWSFKADRQGPLRALGLGLLASAVGIFIIGKPTLASLNEWLPLGLGITGAVTLGYTGITRRRRHVTFGAENRVWMITLLRRYLYQLHRAGFEPVLVVDEIDKLEANSIDPQASSQKTNATSQPTKLSELDRFERTLSRLKQSLGAEFLWILIDSTGLLERVIRDRNRLPAQGPGRLATLIQDEVLVAPELYSDFASYAKKRLGADWKGDFGLLPHWWLIAGGTYFHLRRLVDEARNYPASLPQLEPTMNRKAKLLVELIQYLTEGDFVNVATWAATSGPSQVELRNKLAFSEWRRGWVMEGMIDFARRLYDPDKPLPTYEDVYNLPASQETEGAENPNLLQVIGAEALIALLQNTYANGSPSTALSIQEGEGIAPPPGGDTLKCIRLVIKA